MQEMRDNRQKRHVKKEDFLSWTACACLKNCDNDEHGSLEKNLQSQCALQNNQCPKTISETTNVLTNHQWDDE